MMEMNNEIVSDETAMLECDYDRNPTKISMLIQQKEWDGVKYQAENFQHEARTCVVRRTSPVGLVKWSLLPLHLAILGDCPIDVLRALIESYPDATKIQDDRGMLPIHLAIKKHRNEESINALLQANPDCLGTKNYDNLTPFVMAVKSSSPHRKYYLKALKRGPTYDAVTGSMSDLLCGISLDDIRTIDPKKCLTGLSEMDPRKTCLSGAA